MPVTFPTTLFSGGGNSGGGEVLGAGWGFGGGGCEFVEPDEEAGCELALLGAVDGVPPDEPAPELDGAGALAAGVRGGAEGARVEGWFGGGAGTGGGAGGFVGSGVLAASNCAGDGGDAAPSGPGAGGAASGGVTAP
jgi:hypothetical protein